MSTSKEQAYAALFAKIQTATGAVTSSRVLKHWNDVPPEARPAVFQAQRNMHPVQRTGLPAKWTLMADIYIYTSTSPESGVSPAIQLNALIDAIEAAIAPVPGVGIASLGLSDIKHCFINGTVETDEGTLGHEAVAIIPIEMLLAQ